MKKALFYLMIVFLFLMMASQVFGENVKALLLVSQQYGPNFYFNRDDFEGYGWDITITGMSESIVPCPDYDYLPDTTPDVIFTDITDITQYDILAIMPTSWRYLGANAYNDILQSQAALDLVAQAVDEGLIVYATCAAPRVLAAADRLDGVDMVGKPGYQNQFYYEYIAAGANYLGEDRLPVIHGNIVTSVRDQYYHAHNSQAIMTALENISDAPLESPTFQPLYPNPSRSLRDSSHVIWTNTFGGTQSEGAKSLTETSDDGFIICGYTYSYGLGNADIYLVKTDSDGNQEWTQTYGGPGWEYGYSACSTSDNGYIITGYTTSYGEGGKDIYLIKTDSAGDTLWTKTFGGPGVDVGKSVIETNDGHYLVCGYTESFGSGEDDIWLIKIDANGDIVWDDFYGGTRPEMASAVHECDDGLAILGVSGSPGITTGNMDFYLIKTDLSGEPQWQQVYGNPIDPFPYDWAKAMSPTQDGGYIMVGETNVPSPLDIFIVKTDSTGNTQWVNNFGSQYHDYGTSIQQTNEGGYILCGTIKGDDCKNDLQVIKLDENGNELWTKTLGGSNTDWGSAICQTSDGNFVVAGHTDSFGNGSFDVWLQKISNPLMGDFSANVTSGHAPLQVNFADRSSGNGNSWQWDFNSDGIVDSQAQHPVWTYENPGVYSVTLIVSDGAESQTVTFEDYVNVFDGESALLFDGAESKITCHASESLNLTEAISIEAWINPSGWGEVSGVGYGRIVDKNKFNLSLIGSSPNFNDCCLAIQIFHQGGPPSFSFTPDSSIVLNQWQHVAITYDGISLVKMYINGIEQEVTYLTPPNGPILDHSNYDLVIGNSADGGKTFDGILDEIRIWDGLRSPQEISGNMGQYITGENENLMGYWQMNDGWGQIILDASGNENAGEATTTQWIEGTPMLYQSDIEDDSINVPFPGDILHQNYPNPFNPSTTIAFTIPQDGAHLQGGLHLTLNIYEITGKLIKTLVDSKMEQGYHSVVWNGKDDAGHDVASGVYFYRIDAGSYSETKSMLLLK